MSPASFKFGYPLRNLGEEVSNNDLLACGFFEFPSLPHTFILSLANYFEHVFKDLELSWVQLTQSIPVSFTQQTVGSIPQMCCSAT